MGNRLILRALWDFLQVLGLLMSFWVLENHLRVIALNMTLKHIANLNHLVKCALIAHYCKDHTSDPISMKPFL